MTESLHEILADVNRFALTLDGSARVVAGSLMRRFGLWQDDHFPDQVIHAREIVARALEQAPAPPGVVAAHVKESQP